jgi:phosphocarrier protein HPr
MNVEEIRLTILNRSGLHARAAAKIVEAVKNFDSIITIEKEGSIADAKSIMGLLILAAQQNSNILVKAKGKDAKEAINVITELVQRGFGEGIA